MFSGREYDGVLTHFVKLEEQCEHVSIKLKTARHTLNKTLRLKNVLGRVLFNHCDSPTV